MPSESRRRKRNGSRDRSRTRSRDRLRRPSRNHSMASSESPVRGKLRARVRRSSRSTSSEGLSRSTSRRSRRLSRGSSRGVSRERRLSRGRRAARERRHHRTHERRTSRDRRTPLERSESRGRSRRLKTRRSRESQHRDKNSPPNTGHHNRERSTSIVRPEPQMAPGEGVGPSSGLNLPALGSLTPPQLPDASHAGPPTADVRGHSVDSAAQRSDASALAQALVDAIRSINPVRSQNYFVSSFDPTIHSIDAWCDEVDRARNANGWNDHECLSRVASCLKGDAKVWLSEWVTNDRTWSNFKLEFKPLCPSKLDYANILFDAMKNTSDKYTTYAEYARRTLLRLRVVQGLSDELRTLIVIRGIDNPQVRAAAANASLTSENLVSFLSIYVKPNKGKQDNRSQAVPMKRFSQGSVNRPEVKCFTCGQRGHINRQCPKRSKTIVDPVTQSKPSTSATCAFCKKPGHTEDKCFSKIRSESQNQNQRKVNLCSDYSTYRDADITTAVIDGNPVDVLIDSGALNISLISSDVLKYLSCQPKPRRCVLKGIGDREVIANSYVTVTIELSDISIEADLVVVPAACMNTPVVIGTDILNRDGVTYVRTKDKQYLTHSFSKPSIVNTVTVADHLEVNTQLQGKQREELMSVINEFSEFLISGTAATTVRTGEMEIKLTSSAPVVYRPYKLSYQEKLKVRAITNDLLEKGIIRRSQSEYASPILLVKKRDGSDRLCVDFRALNRITVKDRYPLPLIDDHIDRLGTYRYFTSLDMATGFHQIPIKEECIHLTGFVTPEEHFEYMKMPFGLANSPIVYQRIINNTLRSFIEKGNVLVYIDDVLLLSNEIAEGIALLRDVLLTLTRAGFSINLRKCSFLMTEVEYLGRVVSEGQVRPSPRKVDALVHSLPPENVKQVRQFLGLAGYFRRYIKDYAVKTACVSRLTKKGVEFKWGHEQEEVRQNIIRHLTSKPILAIFDPTLPTEVHTDASSVGYGAVLLQTHTDGKKHVVAYFSKMTQGAEGKYHSYELETLAVVKALQCFRHYLVGLKFVVVTDCNALKSTERKKDLLPRVARWWVYLQDFDFTIEYRKGAMMTHADYLSRNPIAARVNQISRPRNWAQIAQAADEETSDLIQKLQEGNLDANRYVVQNGILYYKYTPVGGEARSLCYIPKGHRLSLLRVFHDEHQHIGVDKTLDLILKHFWFPGLRQFVHKYVSHCLICISKKRVPRAPLQNITSWEKPDEPFHTVHVDALGPLPTSEGYKFILILVDAFSKYTLLFPIRRQDVGELKRVITQAISLFGVPTLMVTDKGRMFESNEFVTWINDLGCELHYITPEMHHANGQVERYVRTVLNMIRIEVNHKQSVWSEILWKLQLVLNITKQKTIQTSALNLLIGTEATTPVIRALIRDVATNEPRPNREALREITRSRSRQLLRENQANQDASANRHRQPPREFQLNDLVFVIKYSQSTGKTDPGMRGPYKVTKILPSGRYELKLLSGGYGKTTQAAAQFMVPWRGEWCPETCAAFFDCDENEPMTAPPGSPTPSSPNSMEETPFAPVPNSECDRSMPLLDPEPIAGPSGCGLSMPLLDPEPVAGSSPHSET